MSQINVLMSIKDYRCYTHKKITFTYLRIEKPEINVITSNVLFDILFFFNSVAINY